MSYKFSRVDVNQPEIVKAFRQLGYSVAHTHTIAGGFPDTVVASPVGFTFLVEIKDGDKPPSQQKLTKDEQEFHDKWPGPIYIINSVEAVLKLHEELNDR